MKKGQEFGQAPEKETKGVTDNVNTRLWSIDPEGPVVFEV